ncbi:hypothetical protein, partial [Caballeronia sp.]|uniref:hypothetical protein n=1 Tax=Caballeronia sp. TaxID=1931223 RepID=UPI003C558AF2
MKPVLPVMNLVMICQGNTLKRRAKKEAISRALLPEIIQAAPSHLSQLCLSRVALLPVVTR